MEIDDNDDDGWPQPIRKSSAVYCEHLYTQTVKRWIVHVVNGGGYAIKYEDIAYTCTWFACRCMTDPIIP